VPELPDLVHVERKLNEAVAGWTIRAIRVGDPTVLRVMVPEPFPAVLQDRTLASITRRGHFIVFGLQPPLTLAVNCMLAGKFQLASPGDKIPRALALALTLEPPGGATAERPARDLRYLDDVRMGKIYVAPPERLGEVPQLGTLGIDLLSPAFTLDAFRALARKRRDQVRPFLMDKSALASIGNAYADEILFAARLHPKTFVRKLSPEDIDRLYAAIGDVTRRAIDEIDGRDEAIEVKVRDFLSVRGRTGQPCPTCGTTLRAVRVGDSDSVFCPQCQPATRALFVDWGKLNAASGAVPPGAPPAAPPDAAIKPGGPGAAKRSSPPRRRPRG
jgi:formamidopyrimidine-DNA glycosylase